MNIADKIREVLDEQGRNQKWLYEEMKKLMAINKVKATGYKNFNKKMNEDKFSSHELIYIAKLLNINLNEYKKLI